MHSDLSVCSTDEKTVPTLTATILLGSNRSLQTYKWRRFKSSRQVLLEEFQWLISWKSKH